MMVALYGINNIGKSTQAKRLVLRMQENGFTATYLKYPIYDLEPTGPRINYHLRDPDAPRLSAEEFQQLYAQNRKDFEPELKKLLEKYDYVVAEDYVGTGIAWGMAQANEKRKMKNEKCSILTEDGSLTAQSALDLTYLEDVNRELMPADKEILMDGERFLEAQEEGHLHESNHGLTEKCREAHLMLAKRYSWPVVSANRTMEEVGDDIWELVVG
jgi:thymidylate kinase